MCSAGSESRDSHPIRIFQPSPNHPLDFEATIERTLLVWSRDYHLQEIRYDPFQMVPVAQRLQRARLPMVEFPQTVGNLTAASSNLYELVKGRNLYLYQDADMRLAASRAVAIETVARVAHREGKGQP
jgi:phage terminase large subunit-like protein